MAIGHRPTAPKNSQSNSCNIFWRLYSATESAPEDSRQTMNSPCDSHHRAAALRMFWPHAPLARGGKISCGECAHRMSSPVLLPHTWLMIPGGIPLRDPSAGPPPRARPPPANFHPPVFLALSFWGTRPSKPEWPRPRGMRKDRKANYKQPVPVACI